MFSMRIPTHDTSAGDPFTESSTFGRLSKVGDSDFDRKQKPKRKIVEQIAIGFGGMLVGGLLCFVIYPAYSATSNHLADENLTIWTTSTTTSIITNNTIAPEKVTATTAPTTTTTTLTQITTSTIGELLKDIFYKFVLQRY